VEPQEYKVILYTGTGEGEGTNADVYLIINGSFGEQPFKLPDLDGDELENDGVPAYYTLTAKKNLGEVKQLVVEIVKTDDDSPDWYLFKVEISTNLAGKEYKWEFPVKEWLCPKGYIPNKHNGSDVLYLTPFGAKKEPDGVIVIIKKEPQKAYLADLDAQKKKEEENRNNT